MNQNENQPDPALDMTSLLTHQQPNAVAPGSRTLDAVVRREMRRAARHGTPPKVVKADETGQRQEVIGMGEKQNGGERAYPEPRSIEAAKARRIELGAEVGRLQSSLSEPSGFVRGRKLSFHEYRTWRTGVIEEIAEKTAESQFLKRWIVRAYRDRKQDVLQATEGDDAESAMKGARDATVRLCRIIQQLRDEVGHLRAENVAMRNRLAELQPDAVAPGDGHDDWRVE